MAHHFLVYMTKVAPTNRHFDYFRVQLFSMFSPEKQEVRSSSIIEKLLATPQEVIPQVKVIECATPTCLANCHTGKGLEPLEGHLSDLIAVGHPGTGTEVKVNRYCGMLLLDADHEQTTFTLTSNKYVSIATGINYDTDVALIDPTNNILALGKLRLQSAMWPIRNKPVPKLKVTKTLSNILTATTTHQEKIFVPYVAIDTQVRIIILSDYYGHCVKIFSYESNLGEIKLNKTVGCYGNKEGELKYPCGVTMDTKIQVAMVADSGNCRICCFSYHGDFIEILNLSEIPRCPRGLALHPTTGLIAVTVFTHGSLSHQSQVVVYRKHDVVESSNKSCVIS